ncbi:hypothetical protein D046_7170B, partial [Vibrio parahaemolyticus V-223/04]
ACAAYPLLIANTMRFKENFLFVIVFIFLL